MSKIGTVLAAPAFLSETTLVGRPETKVEIFMPDPEMHVQTDRARGGTTPHVTRYILMISLPLAVIALLAVLVLF